jgi:RNA polymerase sigma factor (sigma-70 family)
MDSHENVALATLIFTEYESVIRTLIRLHVPGREEQDEVYQNLYLSLVCNPPPQPLNNVPAYLSAVIRSDIIDAVRRRRSLQELVSCYARSGTWDPVERPPEERMAQTEEVRRITDLVADLLPAREATAVIQRYVYGHSTTDVASRMRVKERTVSRYACLGLRRIRAAVGRDST